MTNVYNHEMDIKVNLATRQHNELIHDIALQ